MPIKGLTEKRRLPRIGKMHLGIMATKNKLGQDCPPYPKAVDYFVYPKDGSAGAELREEFVKTFGEKPRELRIIFPLEDEERIASQYYRCYSKTRGLICKGDGETAMRMVDTQTGALADRDSKHVEMKEVPCQGRDCPDYGKKCKELMNLQFILPEISGLGVWQIDTSSINSIRNVNGALDTIRAVYQRVSMIPLLLTLEQIEVTNPDDGKKKKVWVLNIKSPDKMIEAARKARMEPLQLIAGLGEEITEVEVITPTPDDERPELVTPDWEGHAGEPISEEAKVKPGEAEELAKDLWSDEPNQENNQSKLDFNVEWTKESLGKLKWKDSTVKSYCVNVYKVDSEGKPLDKNLDLIDFIASLKREDRESFIKEIQDRLQML